MGLITTDHYSGLVATLESLCGANTFVATLPTPPALTRPLEADTRYVLGSANLGAIACVFSAR